MAMTNPVLMVVDDQESLRTLEGSLRRYKPDYLITSETRLKRPLAASAICGRLDVRWRSSW